MVGYLFSHWPRISGWQSSQYFVPQLHKSSRDLLACPQTLKCVAKSWGIYNVRIHFMNDCILLTYTESVKHLATLWTCQWTTHSREYPSGICFDWRVPRLWTTKSWMPNSETSEPSNPCLAGDKIVDHSSLNPSFELNGHSTIGYLSKITCLTFYQLSKFKIFGKLSEAARRAMMIIVTSMLPSCSATVDRNCEPSTDQTLIY